MANKQRSLEILEDLRFEKRQWRVQRSGWIVMVLVPFSLRPPAALAKDP